MGKIKWTYERCKQAVSECETLKELKIKYSRVYSIIYKNDWDELLIDLKTYKPKNHWNFERCQDAISECKTLKEFRKNYSSSYTIIIKNNWNELLKPLKSLKKPKDYWTYEKCKDAISNYDTSNDFRLNCISAYNTIRRNNWDELLKPLKSLKKPKDYWTYEKCKEAALKCETNVIMYKKYGSAYNVIYKNKWFELFDHMINYYNLNYEKCKEIALTCKTYKELRIKYSSVYNKINKNKWDELKKHFNIKNIDYWTYEKCKEIALTCESASELKAINCTVYNKINKNNWSELKKHFNFKCKPNGYWTYERCKEEALKYNYRSEMDKKNCTVYRTILKNKWTELFSHMERLGNKRMRLIYVYEFNDNYCYIGLTCNINRRNKQHLGKEKDSPVYKHISQTNIIPKLVLKTDYICVDEAIVLEGKILNEYKNNNWQILNKTKTGGIGGNIIKWDKETCRSFASKCKNVSEYDKKYGGAYKSAKKYDWLDEFFPNTSKNGYWNNKELCKEKASTYKNRTLFCGGCWAAYNYSLKNEWLDEFFPIKKHPTK
jgi:predicted GIY-YIG superfamily endonuclease